LTGQKVKKVKLFVNIDLIVALFSRSNIRTGEKSIEKKRHCGPNNTIKPVVTFISANGKTMPVYGQSVWQAIFSENRIR